MKGIFNIDSKFGRMIVKFNQCLLLSLYFILFSIPIVTWGASACALYATARKMLNDEEGKLFHNYWTSFKENFKQGVIVGCLTLLLAVVVIYCTLLMLRLNIFGDTIGKVLGVLYLIIVVMVFSWVHIIIAYIARFNDTMRTVFYNTAYMALLHYNVTFRMGIQLAIVGACFYLLDLFPYLPMVAFLLPSVYSMMTIRPIEKMFAKYLPEEEPENDLSDEDSTEESEEVKPPLPQKGCDDQWTE